jgi:predicted RNA-binding Zn ribbon-like protein
MKTQPDPRPEQSSRADSIGLVGGALCLDFTNTSSGRGTALRQEHLRNWRHLLAWAEHAGIIEPRARYAIERETRGTPLPARRSLHRALTLREAIFVIFQAVAAGKRAPRQSIEILNSVLSEAMSVARVRPLHEHYVWTWIGKPTTLAQLLWPIARSAAELLVGPELGRVKVCPGHGCGWLFVDRTRNGNRRWCEMEICGSRAKMRRYHQRRRAPCHRRAEC